MTGMELMSTNENSLGHNKLPMQTPPYMNHKAQLVDASLSGNDSRDMIERIHVNEYKI